MKTLELFCGTKSFSKVAEKLGHDILTIDNNPAHNPDICIDIFKFQYRVPLNFDIIWASPPCQTFSVASIGKHWNRDATPKTLDALDGISLLCRAIIIIQHFKPKYWFIENPRGMMRKVIDKIFKLNGITDYIRHTITYCQYGDERMKPTDIWTNCKEWTPRPPCKNGDKCHVSAPRGSKTGTQGIKGSVDRGRIPEQLFYEIFKSIR